MTVGTGYADDLKHELLTEMAENFFSRRCRLEQRLEVFAVLRDKVARQARSVLARMRQLRRLLRDDAAADAFLASLGFDTEDLRALPLEGATAPALRSTLALTAGGRYKKAVMACYAALHQEIVQYNDGTYQHDARDPRRMVRIPGHEHLLDAARDLNAEIDCVNGSQCPTEVLHFTKSLDPVRMEQEAACGGVAADLECRLDKDLAFAHIDIDAMGVPTIPTPPAPDDVRPALAELAKRLYAADPEAALAALESVQTTD